MKTRKLVVLLPAYNEEKDVERLVYNWQSYKESLMEQYEFELEMLIIDDGSKDSTKEIVLRLMKQYENLHLYSHDKNQGLGRAVWTGFSQGIKMFGSTSFFCLMDCDNTQDPCYVMEMIKKGKETSSDVVIASRYEGEAKVYGLAKYRELTSIAARHVYSACLRVPGVKDYTCGYRLYTGEILERAIDTYGESFIQENGFTCMAEALYKLHLIGAKFAEVGFELHYDRKEGASKMRVIKTATRSMRLCLGLRFQMR